MNPDSPSYKWWIALTTVQAGMISGIDGTAVGIAIPSMMVSLRADLDQIQWVLTISLIIQTLLMPMTGWLTGLVASRILCVPGLILFNAGTLLCGFAWSAESLIFFRGVQGLLDMPSRWARGALQRSFEGAGDVAGMAPLKADVHLHNTMLEEAAIAAYQDVLLLSAAISLFTIVPGLLRRYTPHGQPKRDQPQVPKAATGGT
jgi:MFS family permease